MKKLFTLFSIFMAAFLTTKSNPFITVASTNVELMRMNLYAVNPDNTSYIVDGTLTQYGNYSNNIDGYDARKMSNPGENISDFRGTTDLVIERRQTIGQTDSIFFRMWNMKQKTYRMELIATNLNHPGLQGFLEDSYLKTSTPLNLNDTTEVSFVITNDPASVSQNRFRIIFKTAASLAPLEIHFTSINTELHNNQVTISWETENENNMKQYFIQRSQNGSTFTDLGTITPYNATFNKYQWSDYAPFGDKNYYRIRSVDLNGKLLYSSVVKASSEDFNSIGVYPNPANPNNLHLKMNNQQPGTYEIHLLNSFGQQVSFTYLNYAGGSSIQKVSFGKTIPTGIYRLEVINPVGKKQIINIVF